MPTNQTRLVGSVHATEDPLDPVPLDGSLNAPLHSNPNPSRRQLVWQHADRQQFPSDPASLSTDHIEPLGKAKPLAGTEGGVDQAGMSCQRAFCRRRLSTSRPPRVCIRFKNPCVRLRLMLEMGRRCFFISPIICRNLKKSSLHADGPHLA